ncbi:MAG TPA: PAS domain S-box protein, partial [Thioalkalivibrio sp.]|nr:PAS domain S-box protein [Thioalkalivibrio sp.]
PLDDAEWQDDEFYFIGADHTGHRRAERQLQSINGLLRALRRISAAALREPDPHRLLQIACDSLVHEGGCDAAWVISVGADRRPVGVIECAPEGLTENLMHVLTSDEPPPCITQALAEPGSVRVHGGGNGCANCPFGLIGRPGQTVVTAVTHGQHVRGALVVHCPVDEVSAEEQALFASLADDLGFQLAMLEGEAAHRRTERQLVERTRMLDAFFDHSLDPAAILDRDFTFVRVNRAYAEAGGYEPDHYVGRNHLEMYPHEENQAIFEQVRDTGRPFETRAKPFEYPDHPEWGVTWWDWTLVPTLGDDGEVELLSFWLRDVTEEQRAKQALEGQRDGLEEMVRQRTAELNEANELLRTIIDASPLAIAVHDMQGNVTVWNPAAEQLSGWSAAEAIGGPPPLVPADKAEEFQRNLERLAAGGEIRGVVAERQRRDGTRLLLELSGAPLFDGAGQMSGSVVLFTDVTERERAARELYDAHALLRTIFDSVATGIVCLDTEGMVTQWNRAIERITGWGRAEALGRIPPFVSDEVRPEFESFLERIRRGETVHAPTLRRHTRTGEEIWLEMVAAPLYGADGSLTGNVAAFMDVTGRVEAERERQRLLDRLEQYATTLEEMVSARTEELLASREELRHERDFVDALMNRAPALMLVGDAEGRVVRFNDACERLTGYREEEVVGRSFVELLVPEDERERVARAIPLAASGELATYEGWWRTRQGGRRLLSWLVTTISRGPDRRYVIAAGWDVTEQRALEQALVESEEKYRELVQNARSIIVRWDSDGTIRFMNDYGLEFFGYAEEELIGRHVGVLVPESDSEGRDLTGLVEAIVAVPEDYWINENENVTADGRRLWVAWANRAIRDDAGELTGIMAIGADRTGQKRVDDELAAQRESLRLLASRLALTEERERREIATALHDNIGQLLAFSKMKMAELVARADQAGAGTAAELRQVLGYVDQAIRFTRSLTTQLSPPVLHALGLTAAVEWLADELEQQHHVAIHVHSEGRLPPLDDEAQVTLFQAVRELMVNALKHAGAATIDVHLSADDHHLTLVVEDRGVGFDVSAAQFPLEAEGGYGLFSVRERLRYLGGELDIQSLPGAGTTARVTVPLPRDDDEGHGP